MQLGVSCAMWSMKSEVTGGIGIDGRAFYRNETWHWHASRKCAVFNVPVPEAPYSSRTQTCSYDISYISRFRAFLDDPISAVHDCSFFVVLTPTPVPHIPGTGTVLKYRSPRKWASRAQGRVIFENVERRWTMSSMSSRSQNQCYMRMRCAIHAIPRRVSQLWFSISAMIGA